MMNIEWQPKALRQARKIKDQSVKSAIQKAVKSLEDWPECKNVKALVGKQGYRLRVGNWRVIFNVRKHLEIIEIMEVKKRDERTY